MAIVHHDQATTPQTPPPAPGHNNPPDKIDEAKAKYLEIRAAAQKWADLTEIEDDDLDDASAFVKQVKAFERQCDGFRLEQNKPHKDAIKANDEKWKGFQQGLTNLAAHLSAMVTKGLQRRREIIEQRQREAAELAEQKRREAEALADRAATSGSFMAQDEAMQAAREADEAERQAKIQADQKANAGGHAVVNGVKRSVGLRTTTRYRVTDTKKLFAAMCKAGVDMTEVETAMLKWVRANKGLWKNKPIVGAESYVEEKAV